jgi:hypothetical protein
MRNLPLRRTESTDTLLEEGELLFGDKRSADADTFLAATHRVEREDADAVEE